MPAADNLYFAPQIVFKSYYPGESQNATTVTAVKTDRFQTTKNILQTNLNCSCNKFGGYVINEGVNSQFSESIFSDSISLIFILLLFCKLALNQEFT